MAEASSALRKTPLLVTFTNQQGLLDDSIGLVRKLGILDTRRHAVVQAWL